MDDILSNRFKEIVEYIASSYNSALQEWNHDRDHARMLFKAQPNSDLSQYYASVLVEYEANRKPVEATTETVVGLDYSSTSLFVDSQATHADYPKKEHNVRKKGDQNREKQRVQVTNQHKLLRQIEEVVIEDLTMRRMAQSLNLANSTNYNGLGMLKTFLTYKLAELGNHLLSLTNSFHSANGDRLIIMLAFADMSQEAPTSKH